jgi:hypothetical protein
MYSYSESKTIQKDENGKPSAILPPGDKQSLHCYVFLWRCMYLSEE